MEMIRQYCPVCRSDGTYLQDADGSMRCVRCADRDGMAITPPAPPHQPQQQRAQEPPRQRDGLMVGTMKLAGFILALMFLLGVGTCMYVCGSAAKTSNAK